MTVEALSTDIQVKLHTNIPELAVAFSDGGGDWVTYVGRNDVFGNTVLKFTVAKNPITMTVRPWSRSRAWGSRSIFR